MHNTNYMYVIKINKKLSLVTSSSSTIKQLPSNKFETENENHLPKEDEEA